MPASSPERNAAACPCEAAGSAVVAVQLIWDGLNVAPELTWKSIEPLVPVGVSTQTGPLPAELGMDVTTNSSVQLSSLVTVASTDPPPPSVKKIEPLPARSPKDFPSKMIVLPAVPLGFVTPFTTWRTGGTVRNAWRMSADFPPGFVTWMS